jgi:hypothetical protein
LKDSKMKLNFWTSLLTLGLTLSMSVAQASERYRLTTSMGMKSLYRGVLEHVAEIPAGTIVEINLRNQIGPQLYEDENRRVFNSRRGWISIVNIEPQQRVYAGSELDYAIDRLRRSRGDMFISETIFQNSNYLQPVRRHVPVRDPVVSRPAPGFNSYEVCYVQPRTQWQTLNRQQADRGRTNAVIGGAATIAGLLLGGSDDRGVRNVGTALTLGGAVLATVGLVQMSNARGPVTVYDTRCDQYYRRDPRPRHVTIQNQRCVTERYYSREWNREVEYFTTTCSGATYYSFERNRQIWY